MRKLLREHYKDLLKEEIDYSSKVATVYHLTGFKTAQYDPNWKKLQNKTSLEFSKEIDDKYKEKKKSRASSILQSVEKSAIAKEAERFEGSKGQAYYIAKNISSSLFDLGSYFQSGGGAMYGKGLYTCYRLNPEIASSYGNVILRFDVDISNFLIFNAGIAKAIYGKNFRLESQFMEILKKKGFDLKGFYLGEKTLDISEEASDCFGEFFDFLMRISESPDFLNSTYDNNTRTSGFALETLTMFSTIFDGGKQIKLRDIIDGIMFYGSNDGPVCIIYHPESMKTYKLTGAGYFDDQGKPIIESDIEVLSGRKSYSLSDSFSAASELDKQNAVEMEEERSQKFRNILANYAPIPVDTDLFKSLTERINKIIDPLYSVLCINPATDIIKERFNTTPETVRYSENIKKYYDFLQIGPSILAEPFIDFVEAFGPGIEIITREEFESYCRILKQYHEKSIPNLDDFISAGLKCQAQNESQFNKLVSQHLSDIITKLDSLINDNILEDIKKSAEVMSGYTEVNINNKYISFETLDVDLNGDSDIMVTDRAIKSNQSIIKDVEEELVKLFSHPKLQTSSGQALLDDYLKYFWIDSSGKIKAEKVAEQMSMWSDYMNMAGDLFYTFLESRKDTTTGELSSYKISKQICDPYFIMKMYGAPQSDFMLEQEYCPYIHSIFKEGSKVINIGTYLTPDIVINNLIEEKTENLRACVEQFFFIEGYRSSPILI